MSRFGYFIIAAIVFIFAASVPALADNPPCCEQDEPEIAFKIGPIEMGKLPVYIQKKGFKEMDIPAMYKIRKHMTHMGMPGLPPMFTCPMCMSRIGMGMGSEMGMPHGFKMPYGLNPDRELVNKMIIHHQGAVEMCDYVIRKGNDPMVKSWAEEIMAVYQEEISAMQQWLDEMKSKPLGLGGMHMGGFGMMPAFGEIKPHFKVRVHKMDGPCRGERGEIAPKPLGERRRMHSGNMTMRGEMSGMVRHLKESRDPDRAFVKIMIKHQSSAVEIAIKALQKAKDERISELALNIIKSNSDEIYKFRNWLEGAASQPGEWK